MHIARLTSNIYLLQPWNVYVNLFLVFLFPLLQKHILTSLTQFCRAGGEEEHDKGQKDKDTTQVPRLDLKGMSACFGVVFFPPRNFRGEPLWIIKGIREN